MANFVRRIVSGNKARFKDPLLDLELDLVYVTDRLIIMGFPAAGVEGLYRNRRQDARRFLEHRHGKNFWVFNFCPLTENSYDAAFFDGRVSRYPFPDHHAPPLAMLPLVAREIHAWLSGSSDRVAVLHCKAGKGRSGTLACAYLLSLPDPPSPPNLQRGMTKKEAAKARADRLMDAVKTEDIASDVDAEAAVIEEQGGAEDGTPAVALSEDVLTNLGATSVTGRLSGEDVDADTKTPRVPDDTIMITSPIISVSEDTDTIVSQGLVEEKKPLPMDRLEAVLALHTAQRMKPPSRSSSPKLVEQKVKHGVSIPSQRRFLHYWALILAGAAPTDFWKSPSSPSPVSKDSELSRRRVRCKQITVRMRELSTIKVGLLRVANHILDRRNSQRSKSPSRSSAISKGKAASGSKSVVWTSLSRYDDAFVEGLERWERHTRGDSSKGMGERRSGSEYMDDDRTALSDLFKDGKWDKSKMVRSFARLGSSQEDGRTKRLREDGEEYIVTHTLSPLSDRGWAEVEDKIKGDDSAQSSVGTNVDSEAAGAATTVPSTASSFSDLKQIEQDALQTEGYPDEGVILDAHREVRVKLFVGQVFMGWFWFIPAFHMPPAPLPIETPPHAGPAHLLLTRKELDFPLGVGTALVDVDVELEWVVPRASVSPVTDDGAKGAGADSGM